MNERAGRPRAGAGTGSGEVARLLSYVVLLAMSGTLFLQAYAIPTSRFEVLGAGAFPMLVHGVLSLLLVAAIAGSLRRLRRGTFRQFPGDAAAWIRARRLVLVLFACLGLYVLAMPTVGYSVATFVFLMVLQATFAPKTGRAMAVALALSVTFSFGLDWLFSEVFNVFLPRGA